jgi:hypothetical protein
MDALLLTMRCPLSGEIMQDPVILACNGLSYERAVLEEWIREVGTNPESGGPLDDARVMENPCFKSLIRAVVHGLGGALLPSVAY